MNRILLVIVATIVLLGAGAGGYWLQHARQQAPVALPTEADTRSMVGQPRPGFALPDLEGEVRDISDWDGNILAVNFWATWCAPCKEEIPEFIELQDRYRDDGVVFIGVALDNIEAVTDFVERYGMNYPVLIGEQAVIDAARAYGNNIGALPYTAFVNREGRIVHTHYGLIKRADAEQLLARLTRESERS
jgi:peroxiredoxin